MEYRYTLTHLFFTLYLSIELDSLPYRYNYCTSGTIKQAGVVGRSQLAEFWHAALDVNAL